MTMLLGKRARRALALLIFAAASAAAAAQTPAPRRDGSGDMAFNLGTWHTEIRRFPDPFANPRQMVKMSGTVTVRPVWNGKALLEEIEADGPQGHWQAATIFLYDPVARQWSQNFINSASGRIDSVPTVGERVGRRMEYYASDTAQGRHILVRGLWSEILPNSHSYEEDYSNDGGRSWHPAFIAHLTRIGAQQERTGSSSERGR